MILDVIATNLDYKCAEFYPLMYLIIGLTLITVV